jgi:uncharacterized protein YceK
MRSRSHVLLCAVGLSLASGCGTVFNLKAPPPLGPPEPGSPYYRALPESIGPSTCFPFGGITRSAFSSGFCTYMGLCGATGVGGIEQIGPGLVMTGAGLVSVIDMPLSLVGDLVTLPVACARWQGAPWATWWGERQWKPSPPPGPQPATSVGPPSEPLPAPQRSGPATETVPSTGPEGAASTSW